MYIRIVYERNVPEKNGHLANTERMRRNTIHLSRIRMKLQLSQAVGLLFTRQAAFKNAN